MNRTVVLSMGLAGALAARGFAGPLNKSRVPADVQWVVHVDVEAGVASTLGQYLSTHRDVLEGLDQIKSETGIDPFSDIKGVTVFGAGADPQNGVAVIDTTAAADALTEKAKAKEPSFKEINEGPYVLYSWSEHGEARFAQLRPGATRDRRIAVVGNDKDRLLAALHVLDGKAPNLATVEKGVLSRSPGEGSIFFAAATNLSEAQAMVFQRADSVVVDLGEREHEVFADLTVVPKNQQDASTLMNAMKGALAFASMYMQSEPGCAQVNKIVQGITFSADEGRVSAHVRFSADLVLGAAGELKGMHDRESENSGDHAPRKHRHAQPAKNTGDDGSPDH